MKQFLPLLIIILSLSSCGSSSSNNAPESKPWETTELDDSYILIQANDQMQFDKTLLKATSGDTLTIALKHTGTFPKASMGHNFVLLKQGVDLTAFARNAASLSDTEYLPEDKSEIIAYTELIGGGESTDVTFVVPASGVYQFLCTFPGHYGMMQGKLVVK